MTFSPKKTRLPERMWTMVKQKQVTFKINGQVKENRHKLTKGKMNSSLYIIMINKARHYVRNTTVGNLRVMY